MKGSHMSTHRTTRRAGALIAATTAAALLVGCAAAADGDKDANASAESTTLSLGHAYSPESLEHRGAVAFAERVAELTDDAVTIQVYPSAQLGSWEEMQEGLELGSVDIVFESLGSLERYTSLASIEGLPFLYNDFDHFVAVWESDLKEEIFEEVRADSGFQLLGAFPRGGGRQLASIRPVESLSDLEGLKIRVPGQDAYIETWQALGASPTPLALNEVFSALEQGAIEATEAPVSVLRSSSFYEVAQHITVTNHLFGNQHFQFWGDSYDALPDDTRAALVQAADDVSLEFRTVGLEEDEDNRTFLEESGVTFYEIDVDEWRARVEHLTEQADPSVQGWVEQISGMASE